MIYNSTEFIFFLAFSIYFIALLPGRFKILALVLTSCFWYSAWSVFWLGIFISILVSNYLLLYAGQRRKWQDLKLFFPALVGFNLLIFFLLKSHALWSTSKAFPYGISFFMLMLMGLVIDRWRQHQKPLEKFDEWILLPIFFPLLVGGPIERGKNIFPQLKVLPLDWNQITNGVLVFSYGWSKKFFIGAPFGQMMGPLLEVNFWNIDLASILILAFLSTLQAYIDFSSYCDMGRGAAMCFGIKIQFNFRPFYYAKNPNDFWQRWNISIGTWMRDYVTMPLMFKFGRSVSPSFLILFSFILIGLWHGLSWNWLIFGLFNGFLVGIYLALQSPLRKSKRTLNVIGLFLVWMIFTGNGLLQHPDAIDKLHALLKFGGMFLFVNGPWMESFALLVPALLVLLLIEYFQERFADLDFFLRSPNLAKHFLAISLVTLFLWGLHEGSVTDYKFELPLYFRF